MPRGRAAGYDAQRELILARAADLFAQHGYPGTSMKQVAESCGVSKPALYHYVRDKYQLLVEIAEGHVERLQSLVGAVDAEQWPPEARLRRLIAHFMAAYADAQSAHRVLTEDVKFLEPADRRRVLDREREVVEAFAQALAAARPDLAAASLQKPLTMLLFGMMNWMFTWLRPGGTLSHAEMMPIVSDLFFGGLTAVVPSAQARRRGRHPQAASGGDVVVSADVASIDDVACPPR